MVWETGMCADEVREDAMEKGECGDVEWEGEAEAEIMCQGVDADIQDCFYGRAGFWIRWQ